MLPENRWRVLIVCPPDALRAGYRNGAGDVLGSVWQGTALLGFSVHFDGAAHPRTMPPAFCHLPAELPAVTLLPRRRAA
jgi:hypothetical protein